MRYWELDLLKGVALTFMVFFHFIFDLTFFTSCDINLDHPIIYFIGISAASLFIIVSGISNGIAVGRHYTAHQYMPYKKIIIRSLKLYAIASCITFVTYITFPEETIWFGILHFLACAGLLTPLIYAHILASTLGFCILYAVKTFAPVAVTTYYLLWLGYIPDTYQSFDYFPLIPWIGLYVLGVFIAKTWYVKAHESHERDIWAEPEQPLFQALVYCGQHTLVIYLAHQPILISLLYIAQYLCF